SEYSMRVWMNPQRMTVLGITPDDVAAAIRAQNIQASIGQVGAPPAAEGIDVQYTLVAAGRLSDPGEFGDIVVRTGEEGGIVRLRDIARVELGAKNYAANALLNGRETASMMIAQAPGANAIDTAGSVLAELQRLSDTFPR